MPVVAPHASFHLDLAVPGPPDAVWTRLWDLDRHSAAIPFTRVRSRDGRPLGHGSRFVGRTGVGSLAFDDQMQVLAWTPPQRAVVRKTGRWLGGTIEVELRAQGRDTRLQWHQTFGAWGVPDALATLVAPVVAAGYRRTLRRIVQG